MCLGCRVREEHGSYWCNGAGVSCQKERLGAPHPFGQEERALFDCLLGLVEGKCFQKCLFLTCKIQVSKFPEGKANA